MPADEVDPRHADFLLGDLFMRNVYSVYALPSFVYFYDDAECLFLDSTMVISPRLGLNLQRKQALISVFSPVLTNLKRCRDFQRSVI